MVASRGTPPGMLRVAAHLTIPIGEFAMSFSRSAGPGGQNVNKLNTKATLRWPVATSSSLPGAVRARFLTTYGARITKDGDLLITSQRFREAPRNAADCLEKLRTMLRAVASPPKPRRRTKRTRSSIEARLRHKRARSERKLGRRVVPGED